MQRLQLPLRVFSCSYIFIYVFSPFQLQSQVMVLGEFARNSEGKTTLALGRLGRIEARLDSVPVVRHGVLSNDYVFLGKRKR